MRIAAPVLEVGKLLLSPRPNNALQHLFVFLDRESTSPSAESPGPKRPRGRRFRRPGALVITPAAGFTVSWDGNDGAGFNPASPAPVPDNLALASNGATSTFPSGNGVIDSGSDDDDAFRFRINVVAGDATGGRTWSI